MDKKEKLSILRKLKEDRLRQEVLIPLFKKMGFQDIIEYHGGSSEKGKDIIFFDIDRMGEKIYHAVVAKIDNITGAVSSSKGVREILYQVEQSFNEPYRDIFGLKELVIDRCFVITSGEIKNTAIESISGYLKKTNLDKFVSFFDGSKLVDKIDRYMEDYFFKERECFNNFFRSMIQEFRIIKDVSVFSEKEGIELEDIYVTLKLMEGGCGSAQILHDNLSGIRRLDRRSESGKRIEPDAAVKRFHRLVILGPPGAGKTTLLKYLALKFCKDNIKKKERIIVPIPIILREFSESGKELRDYIDDVFEKYHVPEAKEFVEKDLNEGRCILLLDGFDELAASEYQEHVVDEIHSFVKQYYECKVVVTSRVANYQEELAGFTCMEVMEFDTDQIKQFIENWFGTENRKQAVSMLKAVFENENIEALARNPLLISIIAIIYDDEKELPQRRTDLYQLVTDVLLKKWDGRKPMKNHFKYDQKQLFLMKLAYRMHCQHIQIITEEEIFEEIDMRSTNNNLGKRNAKLFLDEICQRSEILRQITTNTYDFLHFSFQEYFVALELDRQEDGFGSIISHIHEPWWEEPILLYAGIKKDPSDLIKKLQRELPDDIFKNNLIISGQCIADSEDTDKILENEIAQQLWSLSNESEFSFLRERAKHILRRLKPQKLMNEFIGQLTDKNAQVRKKAASQLGIIGAIDSVPQLIEVMMSDKDDNVRIDALNSLGAIADIRAVPALIEIINGPLDSKLCIHAIDVLGTIGSEKAVPPLVRLTDRDNDSQIRAHAINSLGNIGGDVAVSLLKKIAIENEGKEVRTKAISALGIIGNINTISPLIKLALEDSDVAIRRHAIDALGKISDVGAVQPLLQILTMENLADLRIQAAKALGAIGDYNALPVLQEVFQNDRDESVRLHVAGVLGEMGSGEASSLLIESLFSKKDSEIRLCAVDALGKIGGDEVVPPLLKTMVSDIDLAVRRQAIEVLGKIGNEAAVELLEQLFSGEKNFSAIEIKNTAYEALFKISKRLGIRIAGGIHEQNSSFTPIAEEANSPLIEVRNVIHQLTAPIKSLIGYSESLLKKDVPRPKLIAELARINRLSKMSLTYANNFEKFLEIDSNGMRISKEKILDLRDYLIGITMEYRMLVRNKFITIHVTQRTPSTIDLHVDKTLFRHVIAVILDNAVKYSFSPEERQALGFQVKPHSREDLENVLITADEDHDCVLVTVSSCGLEIMEDEKDKIFYREFRGVRARERLQIGTGIGLYIARKIIESHNGKIELVSNTPKYNTVLQIILPKNP